MHQLKLHKTPAPDLPRLSLCCSFCFHVFTIFAACWNSSIWAVFSTCTLTLNLLFFQVLSLWSAYSWKFPKHTHLHIKVWRPTEGKNNSQSPCRPPPPLSPKPPFCSIPPSLPSSSLGPLAVTVFPLSLAPLYDPPSFGRNCSRYFFSLSLVNVYPAWRFF